MGIPILGEIEKLINEHGSAAILKERLSLAADQYAALEKKLSDSESRVQASELRAKNLESEKQGFELENLKLKEKLRNLEEKLKERHGQRLEDTKEKLLQLLAAQPHVNHEQISRATSLNAQVVMFHLEELQNARLVNASYSSLSPTEWSLDYEGRAYLVRHGLLS